MSVEPQTSNKAGRAAGLKAGIALAGFVAVIGGFWAMDPAVSYLWIKALHVISIIAWMAGMVYLPRLFVYHTDAESGSVQSETFKVMEKRLLKVIMTPAMIISWALGLWLAWAGGYFAEVWFVFKFVGVIALTAAHIFFATNVRLFANDNNSKTARQWRMYNEIPTVLMIFIVIMVVVKPF